LAEGRCGRRERLQVRGDGDVSRGRIVSKWRDCGGCNARKGSRSGSTLQGSVSFRWRHLPLRSNWYKRIRKRFEPLPRGPGISADRRDPPYQFAHRGIGSGDGRNPASAAQDRRASSRRSSNFPIRCRRWWPMDANADGHRPLHNRLLGAC